MAEETQERRSRGDGFNRVTLLGRLAADPEILGEYGRKGRQVFVEGRLHNNEYTDKEGSKQKRD